MADLRIDRRHIDELPDACPFCRGAQRRRRALIDAREIILARLLMRDIGKMHYRVDTLEQRCPVDVAAEIRQGAPVDARHPPPRRANESVAGKADEIAAQETV